jgi:hypothetical protein
MYTSLTIIRYKSWAIPFAFISMAIFRIPLGLNKEISFYKLMGSGKNGTFDKVPDLKQWAIFSIHTKDFEIDDFIIDKIYGSLISKWIRYFSKEHFILKLAPVSGHGYWDKQPLFQVFSQPSSADGPMAVLTRATIRMSKIFQFWKNVDPIALKLKDANGLLFSVGIGEIPWIKQATFSVWKNMNDMKDFAYSMKEHREVVKQTRKDNWYAEDMFIRFNIIDSKGTLHGKHPLQ